MQAILQHIFQKNSLQEVPLEALERLTREHPYFAPGQLLLARKLQLSGDQAFEAQVQKTAVYFPNPLWLGYLLTVKPVEAAEPETGSRPHAENEPESSGADTGEEETPDLSEPALGDQPLLRNILDAPAPTATLELQAYHTIDYFASQGIHFRAGEQTGDKLDKGMKSFTEWLKTMRRLPQTARLQLDTINDEAIYRQASGSLEEKEILTETMAEVLAKQHNREKAVQIYNKLGLQDPSKKAYFAAKIEALKP